MARPRRRGRDVAKSYVEVAATTASTTRSARNSDDFFGDLLAAAVARRRAPVGALRAVSSFPSVARLQRFTKAMRLRRQGEFDAVFRGGARVHGDLVTLIGRAGEPGLRLGVPCGKRYSKRAVDRNRFRRLVREVVRRAAPELPSGLDFVVLPRGKPDSASFASLDREIRKLLPKLARKLEERAP